MFRCNWFLFVLAALLAMAVFAAGCSRPRQEIVPAFHAGQLVELRLTGERGQVTYVNAICGKAYYEVRLASKERSYVISVYEYELEASE